MSERNQNDYKFEVCVFINVFFSQNTDRKVDLRYHGWFDNNEYEMGKII